MFLFVHMIHMYISRHFFQKHVEADHLVKLLPRPGDGDKREQLLSQKVVDFMVMFLSGPS